MYMPDSPPYGGPYAPPPPPAPPVALGAANPICNIIGTTAMGTLGGLAVTGLFIAGTPVWMGAALGALAGVVSSVVNEIFTCIIPAHLQQNPLIASGRFIISISMGMLIGAAIVAAGAPIALPTALILGGASVALGTLLTSITACCCGMCCIGGAVAVGALD